MTEITKQTGGSGCGWVLIDGECPMCVGLAGRLAGVFDRSGYCVAPQQTPWVRERLGLTEGEPLTELCVLSPSGQVVGGADAIVFVARSVWWAWPFVALTHIPGVMIILRAFYRRFAANRHCISNACYVRRSKPIAWGPLVLLPAIAIAVGQLVSPWIFMWLLAFSIYAGCKWLTWYQASSGCCSRCGRYVQYLFCWPGMDAHRFLNSTGPRTRMTTVQWAWSIFKVAIGCGLFFAASRFEDLDAFASGIIAIVGLGLLLHFGLFEILAHFFQTRGIQAAPIMRRPFCSTTLGEFWGRCWNTAFSELLRQHVFLPLSRRFNPQVATVASFFASGLVHDLVISLPAGAGLGQPTLYFLIQALGVFVQRTAVAKAMGLHRGPVGWAFTMAIVIAPVSLLFTPPFIVRVVLPFTSWIAAW